MYTVVVLNQKIQVDRTKITADTPELLDLAKTAMKMYRVHPRDYENNPDYGIALFLADSLGGSLWFGEKSFKHLQGKHDQKLHGSWSSNRIRENRGLYESQIQSPGFKKWFEGSKVVDENGNPKIMYHGSGAGFEEFDINGASPTALYGPGFYFTDDVDVAGGVPSDAKTLEDAFAKQPYNLSGYSFANQKRELNRHLTESDLKKAKKVFESREIQQAANEDIGTRDNYRTGYEFLKNGNSYGFSRWLADEAPNSFLSKIDKNLTRQYTASPMIYDVFLSIKKPFDAEKKFDFNEVMGIIDKFTKSRAKPNDPYEYEYEEWKGKVRRNAFSFFGGTDSTKTLSGSDVFKGILSGSPYKKDMGVKVLRAAGYDGITHEGGNIVGNKKHTVWIAFEPGQIKSVRNAGGFADPKNITKELRDYTLKLLSRQ